MLVRRAVRRRFTAWFWGLVAAGGAVTIATKFASHGVSLGITMIVLGVVFAAGGWLAARSLREPDDMAPARFRASRRRPPGAAALGRVGARHWAERGQRCGASRRSGRMADVSVRRAATDDAAEIARIQVVTWQHGYATILPAAVLDQVTEQAAAGRVDTGADRPADAAAPRARRAGGRQRWSGSCARPARGPPARRSRAADDVAIGPVLVEPRWGRRGHGSRLMAAAVDLARARRA